jgi:hypothetical protein
MSKKMLNFFILFFALNFARLYALDIADGRIRYSIDERSGRFSLYYMTDVDSKKYEPLFWDRDKKTSVLTVSSNGTEYRLGDASQFKMYVRGTKDKPVLAFESQFLSVTEEFSFIRTASSGVTNGIRIDIKVENWGDKKQDVGARLIIDTFLGEKSDPNFRTNARPISSEARIDSTTQDRWWVSENGVYGLMGSVFVDGVDSPDYLHFANWKRLYNAKFTAEYIAGRNFNDPPFSIRDSAVCYYMDIKPLERWHSRSFTVLLAAMDQYGFDVKKNTGDTFYETIINSPSRMPEDTVEITETARGNTIVTTITPNGPGSMPSVVVQDSPTKQNPELTTPKHADSYIIGPMRVDLMTLRALIYKVDEHIYFNTPVTEAELRGMEETLAKLRSRYGGIFSPY